MKIKNVEFYGKKSDDATITVVEGEQELNCYCFEYSTTAQLQGILTCLIKKISASKENHEFIKKQQGFYSYLINGKVKDVSLGIVECKGFEFQIDELPDYAELGQFFLIDVIRIDIE